MLFNSFEFIFLFLPVVWIIFFATSSINKSLASLWLVISSLFFYGYWNRAYVLLLIVSIMASYLIGSLISKSIYRHSALKAKTLLIAGIIFNLFIFIYYKYANFLVNNVSKIFGSGWVIEPVILPLGLSFFTFTQIAFLVDVYQRKVREGNLIHYSLFVSYFPHLIAGPVLHHKQMMPQFSLASIYKPKFENLFFGLGFFSIGLIKKVLLADNLANFARPVFAASNAGFDLHFFAAWIGILAFTFQLYFDFSGYSDMAIGISKMFGIDLPVNFNSPYKSRNIIEFWRRWHISLSTFLRDYLYIPLGGSRKGSFQRYLNLFITMILGGLWHGANWTFVVWGFMHGLYLCINYLWRYLCEDFARYFVIFNDFFKVTITFISVVFAWVFFKSSDIHSSVSFIKGLIGLNGFSLPVSLNHLQKFVYLFPFHIEFNGWAAGLAKPFDLKKLVVIFLISSFVIWGIPNSSELLLKNNLKKISRKRLVIYSGFFGALFSLCILSFKHISEFLYFQF